MNRTERRKDWRRRITVANARFDWRRGHITLRMAAETLAANAVPFERAYQILLQPTPRSAA